jgi:hypothetical protein
MRFYCRACPHCDRYIFALAPDQLYSRARSSHTLIRSGGLYGPDPLAGDRHSLCNLTEHRHAVGQHWGRVPQGKNRVIIVGAAARWVTATW